MPTLVYEVKLSNKPKLNGSSLHMLAMEVLVYGSRYRRVLHCQCKKSDQYFRQADERIKLHCMVRLQYQIPKCSMEEYCFGKLTSVNFWTFIPLVMV